MLKVYLFTCLHVVLFREIKCVISIISKKHYRNSDKNNHDDDDDIYETIIIITVMLVTILFQTSFLVICILTYNCKPL